MGAEYDCELDNEDLRSVFPVEAEDPDQDELTKPWLALVRGATQDVCITAAVLRVFPRDRNRGSASLVGMAKLFAVFPHMFKDSSWDGWAMDLGLRPSNLMVDVGGYSSVGGGDKVELTEIPCYVAAVKGHDPGTGSVFRLKGVRLSSRQCRTCTRSVEAEFYLVHPRPGFKFSVER